MMWKGVMHLLFNLWIGGCLINGDISSWDSYIDILIAESKDAAKEPHCDKACIIDLDGGAPRTTNNHTNALRLQDLEGEDIARAFKSKNFTSFLSDGISIEGVSYKFLNERNGTIVMGKKPYYGSVTLQATRTTIVIAHCPEGLQQGYLNKGVKAVVGHIESSGL